MHFHRDLTGPALSSACVLAMGAFDGIHLGHQALLKSMVRRARTERLNSAVLSFEPLPREYFRTPDFLRLTPLRQKLVILAEFEVEIALCTRFNASMRQRQPHDFIAQVVERLKPKIILVGADFRFGYQRSGTVETLRQHASHYGYVLEDFADVMSPSTEAQERLSASQIRAALLQGEVQKAHQLLGRAFRFSGRVRVGNQLARTLGFPTANLHWLDCPPAMFGVYAVRVSGAGLKAHPAVASLGVRPVVQGQGCWLEVHALDFRGDLYNQRLEVDFIEKIRGERNFDGADPLAQLQRQVDLDIQSARRILSI